MQEMCYLIRDRDRTKFKILETALDVVAVVCRATATAFQFLTMF